MTRAPTTAATADQAGPQDQPDRERGPQDQSDRGSARLLCLIHRLIDYGRDLLGTLQQQNTPDPPPDIAYRFGVVSLAPIIARITRGLILAIALRDRVTRNARRLDAPAPRPSHPSPVRSARPRPAPWPDDDAAELANLPSVREIAERVRHRPIGAVIGEICRDLGIDASHPLWSEVLRAITLNGGDRGALIRTLSRRGFDAAALGLEPVPPPAMVRRIEGMVLEGTVPERTVPERTVLERTVPERTVPERTVPERTVPERTVPERTVLERMVPDRMVPDRMAWGLPPPCAAPAP